MEKIKKKYSKTDCLILGIGFLILGLFVGFCSIRGLVSQLCQEGC